ncbi:MAG: DinB family protein, partial [Flavobacteriales bacterium]
NILLRYIELADLKNRVLNNLVDFSTEELNFKPTEDQWSIAQVLDHLIETETGTNKYVNYTLKTIDLQPRAGVKSYLGSKVLNKKLKSDEKFKVPSMFSEPEKGKSYAELKDKWDKSRIYLIQTVETFPKGKRRKAIFKHPKAGLLNMNQTLLFMINHIHHHIPQIDALRFKLANQNKKR